jgi:hypothetical protein
MLILCLALISEFCVVSVAYFLFNSLSIVFFRFLLELREYEMFELFLFIGELFELETFVLSDDFLDPDKTETFFDAFRLQTTLEIVLTQSKIKQK